MSCLHGSNLSDLTLAADRTVVVGKMISAVHNSFKRKVPKTDGFRNFFVSYPLYFPGEMPVIRLKTLLKLL